LCKVVISATFAQKKKKERKKKIIFLTQKDLKLEELANLRLPRHVRCARECYFYFYHLLFTLPIAYLLQLFGEHRDFRAAE